MKPKQFEEFLATYRPALVARAENITGDRALAEDVVQTTSVYLLKNIHRYDPDQSSLLTWVLGSITRRAFNILRAEGRFVPVTDGPDTATPGVDVACEEASKMALLTQMRELLEGDITFHLAERVATGETIEQIAEAEGVSGQAISQRLAWAYKRWRKLLARRFTRAEIETALGR